MIPIGAILSNLSEWVRRMREKRHRDSRNPYIKSDAKTFGFLDFENLPLAENDAVGLAKAKMAENDFSAAKHILVNAWLTTKNSPQNELAFLRLKEGFVDLYQTQGQTERAAYIAGMPVMLIEKEMQWIVEHPDADLGAAVNPSPD